MRLSRYILFLLILLATSAIVAVSAPVCADDRSVRIIERVTIDPGHGGDDKGVVGPGGLAESRLVYDLAVQVKEALESELDLKVFLTHEEDRKPSLIERTGRANGIQSDLLLSIHAGGGYPGDGSGYGIFYQGYGFQSGLADAVKTPGPSEKWAHAQFGHIAASKLLAGELSRALQEVLRIKGYGPSEQPLALLAGSAQPAVLLEVGDLTNPEGERRLRTQGYRDALTRAIVLGIREWRRRLQIMDEE